MKSRVEFPPLNNSAGFFAILPTNAYAKIQETHPDILTENTNSYKVYPGSLLDEIDKD